MDYALLKKGTSGTKGVKKETILERGKTNLLNAIEGIYTSKWINIPHLILDMCLDFEGGSRLHKLCTLFKPQTKNKNSVELPFAGFKEGSRMRGCQNESDLHHSEEFEVVDEQGGKSELAERIVQRWD